MLETPIRNEMRWEAFLIEAAILPTMAMNYRDNQRKHRFESFTSVDELAILKLYGNPKSSKFDGSAVLFAC